MGDNPHRSKEPQAGIGETGPQPVGLRSPRRLRAHTRFRRGRAGRRGQDPGPAAFKRWRTMGAEISHPDSVAQVAVYTYGLFNEPRPAVIATMDTGSRQWDFEVIPASRVTTALEKVRAWLSPLVQHSPRTGRTPKRFPGGTSPREVGVARAARSYWPAQPGDAEEETPGIDERKVSTEEARLAVASYTAAQEAARGPERTKREALDTLKAWIRGRDNGKESIGGRTVSLVRTTRFSVNHRRLTALLDPETRAEVISENASEHVRVT